MVAIHRAEVSLGQVLVHVLGDLAGHAGHADILREQLDGQVGLRPSLSNVPHQDAEQWKAYVVMLQGISDGFSREPDGR